MTYKTAILGVALCALFTPSAFAENAYVKLETGVSVLKLPPNLFFANRGEAAPFARFDDLNTDSGVLVGADLDLTVGANLPTPVLGADSTTVEFRGAFQALSGSTSARFDDTGPGERFGWVLLNNATNGYGTGTGNSLQTTTNRSAQYFEVEALLKSQFGQFEVFFGPDLRRLGQQLNMRGEIDVSIVTLAEVLSTVYGGATIGASMAVVDNATWMVNILGAVSLLGAHTQYDGTYDDNDPGHQTASLTDQQFAVGAKARLTVEKHISPNTTLGGYLAAEFLSYSPQVDYGSVPADPASGVLRLVGSPLFGASAGVILKHKFD